MDKLTAVFNDCDVHKHRHVGLNGIFQTSQLGAQLFSAMFSALQTTPDCTAEKCRYFSCQFNFISTVDCSASTQNSGLFHAPAACNTAQFPQVLCSAILLFIWVVMYVITTVIPIGMTVVVQLGNQLALLNVPACNSVQLPQFQT